MRMARPTKLFLGVGSLEQTGHDMVGAATTLAALLQGRGDPNLAVESRVFADETHASIFPVAFSSGVRHFSR